MSWKIEFQIICFQTNLHLENQVSGLLEKLWGLLWCWLTLLRIWSHLSSVNITVFACLAFEIENLLSDYKPLLIWGAKGVSLYLWHMQKNMTEISKYFAKYFCSSRILSLLLLFTVLQMSRTGQNYSLNCRWRIRFLQNFTCLVF